MQIIELRYTFKRFKHLLPAKKVKTNSADPNQTASEEGSDLIRVLPVAQFAILTWNL